MEKITAKLVSGKFLLTIICGVVFAYVSCKKIIPPEATVGIISTVITFYFTKNQVEKKEDLV